MAQVSRHSSSQNVGACDLFPYRAIERERETFLKSAFFYTEQEKCSYKTLLKEKIHDLMQAFPLERESH